MPSLKQSYIQLDPQRYRQSMNVPQPPPIFPAPQFPIAIRRSTVMISSMPSVATSADGITRQFYGGRIISGRIMLP